jgi:hypothetical protein
MLRAAISNDSPPRLASCPPRNADDLKNDRSGMTDQWNGQPANYETASQNMDETLNKGVTIDPGAPVVFSPTIPDPTIAPQPAPPATESQPGVDNE